MTASITRAAMIEVASNTSAPLRTVVALADLRFCNRLAYEECRQ